MRLKNAALMAAFFMAAAFLLRSVVTLFTAVSYNVTVVRGIMIVLILQVLALMLFYIFFRSDYVAPSRHRLKTAAAWAIVAQVLMLVALGRDGLQIFEIEFLPEILYSSPMNTLIPLFPWAAALLVLIFFMAFSTDDTEEEKQRYKKAKLFGLIAAAMSFLFQTVVGVWLLRSGAAAGSLQGGGRITLAAAPFVIALVFLFVLFFLSFYKGRDIL